MVDKLILPLFNVSARQILDACVEFLVHFSSLF